MNVEECDPAQPACPRSAFKCALHPLSLAGICTNLLWWVAFQTSYSKILSPRGVLEQPRRQTSCCSWNQKDASESHLGDPLSHSSLWPPPSDWSKPPLFFLSPFNHWMLVFDQSHLCHCIPHCQDHLSPYHVPFSFYTKNTLRYDTLLRLWTTPQDLTPPHPLIPFSLRISMTLLS